MTSIQLLRGGTTLISLLIGGEALTLLIGMHFLSERPNLWISIKNDFLLLLDLVTALGLFLIVMMNKDVFASNAFYVFALVSLLSHGYRGWEYLACVQNKFCINVPLFIINDLKLLGLLIVLVLNLVGKPNSTH
jgi:hypothetical protein